MNVEEAKLILQCRRYCGSDDNDPAIREALDIVAADAEATAHLRREEAVDSAICRCLRSVEPPADLCRRILVGAKVTRTLHWWQRRMVWLAAAAALAVAFPLALKVWPGSQPGGKVIVASILSDFQTMGTKKLNDGPNILRMSKLDDVNAHIAARSKLKTVPVPPNLCHCDGGPVGCAVFDWNGREVTLICFNAGDKGTVHLFTVDASILEEYPATAVCVPLNGWQTRAWIEDGKLMMLAGSEKTASESDLKLLAEY